jgi:hypothetical protein
MPLVQEEPEGAEEQRAGLPVPAAFRLQREAAEEPSARQEAEASAGEPQGRLPQGAALREAAAERHTSGQALPLPRSRLQCRPKEQASEGVQEQSLGNKPLRIDHSSGSS